MKDAYVISLKMRMNALRKVERGFNERERKVLRSWRVEIGWLNM